MNLIKINNQNLDLGVSLPPNIFAFHVLDKNKKHVRTIVAEYADGLPFQTNHRHFADYIANIQSSIVKEFYKNFFSTRQF